MLSGGYESLRDLIVELHSAHDGAGEPLACMNCVFTALNQAEAEYVQRCKDLYGRG